jgi:hypothetical protein
VAPPARPLPGAASLGSPLPSGACGTPVAVAVALAAVAAVLTVVSWGRGCPWWLRVLRLRASPSSAVCVLRSRAGWPPLRRVRAGRHLPPWVRWCPVSPPRPRRWRGAWPWCLAPGRRRPWCLARAVEPPAGQCSQRGPSDAGGTALSAGMAWALVLGLCPLCGGAMAGWRSQSALWQRSSAP